MWKKTFNLYRGLIFSSRNKWWFYVFTLILSGFIKEEKKDLNDWIIEYTEWSQWIKKNILRMTIFFYSLCSFLIFLSFFFYFLWFFFLFCLTLNIQLSFKWHSTQNSKYKTKWKYFRQKINEKKKKWQVWQRPLGSPWHWAVNPIQKKLWCTSHDFYKEPLTLRQSGILSSGCLKVKQW